MSATEPTYGANFYARLFNLTERRIQQLAKDGVIPKSGRGKYPLLGTVRGYVTYLQERQLNNEVGAGDFHLERTLLTKANRERAEFEVEQLRGELLSRDEVVEGVQQMVSAAKSKLLAVPVKAAAEVALLSETQEIQAMLQDFIYEALNELRNYRQPGLDEFGDVGLGAAAEANG